MAESGLFYSLFIDPLLKSMRKKVAGQIQNGETVIDIACGTGAQIFELADKTTRAVGVDLSESMIKVAKKEKQKRNVSTIEFVVADATNLSEFVENEFDVAIMSLALHQFTPELYAPVLSEMKRISRRIVIVDYAVPLPKNLAGVGSKIIEFLAGIEHNRCFKEYYKVGGLNLILKENGITIKSTKCFGGGAFCLADCAVV